VDEVSSDLTAVATFVESFRPPMFETYDHIP
jgi:hypothetical protein